MPSHYIQNVNTTLLFIEEVKKRPQLWDNTVPGYHTQKHNKLQLWDEICELIEPEFREKSYAERQHIRTLTQRRWKSLRDCFTRELARMKKLKSKTVLSSYKPYCYFKNLGFLLDIVEHASEKISASQEVEESDSKISAISVNRSDDYPQGDTNTGCEKVIEDETNCSKYEDVINKKVSVSDSVGIKQINASKILKMTRNGPNSLITNDSGRAKNIKVVRILPVNVTSVSSNIINSVSSIKKKECQSNNEVLSKSNVNIISSVNSKRMCLSSETLNGAKQTKDLNEIIENKHGYNNKSADDRIGEVSLLERKARNSFRNIRNQNQKIILDEDEDRLFLLSLIKELKKVPDDYKLDVKLEIMNAIKKGKNRAVPSVDRPFSSDVFSYHTSCVDVDADIPSGNIPQSPESFAIDSTEFKDENEPWSCTNHEIK